MISDQLVKDIEKLVEKKKLFWLKGNVTLEHPTDLNNGDYSSNIALRAKQAPQTGDIGPYDSADEIAKKLISDWELPEYIEKVEVDNGFINFWLSRNYLIRQLELSLKEGERYGSSDKGKGKKAVVEYSSPNIAKHFGIGHLRSTIIGQTIYNLYQFLGYNTVSDNHLGDWGTQFGAIIYQVISSQLSVSSLSVDEFERLYVDFNTVAHDKPELWEEARKWFKKLEDGDNQAREIWKTCVKVSLEEFERIYKLLDISFDNMHGESFYEDKMAVVIQELKDKNLVVEDKGALIIKYPADEFTPGIILKSDGATTYLTRDLAQVKFRLSQWNPDLLIYEVGVEQTLHFRQLFRAVELLGWVKRERFVHVRHGLYLSPGGKKFSTRRGETVKIEDVLNEAVERARKLGESSLDVASDVGIGAVKYFDLSHSPESNIIFSWDKMFLLTGNSGPYLQYTHARAQSVLRKSKTQQPAFSNQLPAENWKLQAEELVLLRTFYKFPEVVESAAEQFAPNLLCNFLYDLASKYNLMYNNIKILKWEVGSEKLDEEGRLRVALTAVTANILKTGLGLLGISAPERM